MTMIRLMSLTALDLISITMMNFAIIFSLIWLSTTMTLTMIVVVKAEAPAMVMTAAADL
jgi:polyferredoxin